MNQIKSIFINLLRWPRWGEWLATFGLVLVFVPFMAKKKEWYPFSHFPMYSNLADIWTLKVTNEKDEPVSIQRELQGGPNSIRKLATARLREVQKEWGIKNTAALTPKAWAEAAKRTMEYLAANHPPRPNTKAAAAKALRVYRVEYGISGGEADKKDIFLFESPMPAPKN